VASPGRLVSFTKRPYLFIVEASHWLFSLTINIRPSTEVFDIEIKKEDSHIARWLLVGAVICTFLSAPMFHVHFREAVAKAPIPLSIPLLFIIEILKVALFSWLAVTAGRRWARPIGLDVPVLREMVRGQFKNALEVAKKPLLVGIFLGLAGFVVRLGAGFLLGETSILGTLGRYNHGLNPLIVADAVFYQFGVMLWFGWGTLSMATYTIANLAGISGARAFPWGNAVAALAFGLFACVSVYSPHRGEVGAHKYIVEAFLLYGLPNFFFCLGVHRWGLLSAMVGVGTGTILGAVVTALF